MGLDIASVGTSSFLSLTRSQSSCWLRLWFHLKACLEGIHTQAYSHGYWQSLIHPHVSFSSGLPYNMAASLPRGSDPREGRESKTKLDAKAFYNLVLGVMSITSAVFNLLEASC